MTVRSQPRPRLTDQPRPSLVERALADARQWCAGEMLNEHPAYSHGVWVACTIVEHVPDPAPDLIAAVLLHNAPDFAPAEVDLDVVLSASYTVEVHRIVSALQYEHRVRDQPNPIADAGDRLVLLARTAHRIVTIDSWLYRAGACGDVHAYLAAQPRVSQLQCFLRCQAAAQGSTAVGLIPDNMSAALSDLLAIVRSAFRGGQP